MPHFAELATLRKVGRRMEKAGREGSKCGEVNPVRQKGKSDWQAVDIHCHILPGIDDGAENREESLKMLRMASEEGFTDIVATPHYRAGRFETTAGEIQQKLHELRKAAIVERIPVRIYAGSEIYYFEKAASFLREGRLCTMNGTSFVLVEFSPTVLFQTMRNAMEELLGTGYSPILAHAERYSCLVKDMEKTLYLHETGVRIQINATSVTGESGTEARRFTHSLMREDAVEYIGTDAHGSRHRRPEIRRCRKEITKEYGDEYARRVMRDNAMRMLGI